MLSHDGEQGGLEGEESAEGRYHLNSNSLFGRNDRGPRVSSNGTVSSKVVVPGKVATANGNEYGQSMSKNRLIVDDVAALVSTEVIKKCKGNSLVEVNSEEAVRGSPKHNIEVGNGILCESNILSSRTKEDEDFTGKGSGVALNSFDCKDDENRGHKGESLGNCGSLKSSSRSRTRSAHLSGIGYLEEMAKLYKNGLSVEGDEVNKRNSSSGGNNLDIPPGFGNLVGEKADGGLINLEVGVPYSFEASSIRKRNGTKRHHNQPNKRVTRSQIA